MSETDRHLPEAANLAHADWRQLETFIDELYDAAHARLGSAEFYRQLLAGCVTLMAAEGGAVWLPAARGRWRAAHQMNSDAVLGHETSGSAATHVALLTEVAKTRTPVIFAPRSRGASGAENSSDRVIAAVAVVGASDAEGGGGVQALIELFLHPGSSPEVQQGWQELLATVRQAASEFHVYDELRRLRAERQFYDQSLALVRRFQQSMDLRAVAFEIANEGRRFVAGDRLSVLVRSGKAWRLLATSGVDRIETRSDAAKHLQRVAAATADWGEPLEHNDAEVQAEHDLPPELATLVEQHVDQSHARQLVAVPIEFETTTDQTSRLHHAAAVLVVEQFSTTTDEFSRQCVIELARLCQPALRQAHALDRFPVRSGLRWADRLQSVWEKWGPTKLTLAALATLAVIAALVFVPCDFEVQAPATMVPIARRDIFATTDGKVAEVRVTHGQVVQVGDVLAVLSDPQLSLDGQRVDGEILTTRKRLEAIAVARTDRQVREDTTHEKLPLAAEAEQLQKRLTSLQAQQEILAQRRASLTLRSPIAGSVLTLDVQNLLRTRPVQRGQVLFTVADTTAGWRLLAEMPQDRIGQIVAAQEKDVAKLPARFRLAGDTDKTYRGHVESISTAAVLDASSLDHESPAFEMIVAVNEKLPSARPGMSAEVRVDCGQRSLGYVWLHDVWETLYRWLVF